MQCETLTQMCVFELLWVLLNSTAWKDKHKAPCWGNGISCVGGRSSEPMLLWSDLFLVIYLDNYNKYVKYAIHLSPSASRNGNINAISSWTVGFSVYFGPYTWQAILLYILTLTLKKFWWKIVGMTGRWVQIFQKEFGMFCTHFSVKNMTGGQMYKDVYSRGSEHEGIVWAGIHVLRVRVSNVSGRWWKMSSWVLAQWGLLLCHRSRHTLFPLVTGYLTEISLPEDIDSRQH